MEKYDFSGWATRNDLQCSDGRIIRRDAFKHCDGVTVPLVWNHDHTDPYRVVGHALLENREDGVYTYGKFNETDLGKTAKIYVEHGDITSLSIYANQLKQQGPNVIHGAIREVSLVLAGANPGAYIENVMMHGEESEEEAMIQVGSYIEFAHADGGKLEEEVEEEMKNEEIQNIEEMAEEKEVEEEEELAHSDEDSDGDETIADVLDTLTDKQKKAMYALVGYITENENSDDKEDNEEEEEMKHNVFEKEEVKNETAIAHSAIVSDAIADAKRFGSLRESMLQHAAANNITDIGELFPTLKDLNMPPEWIKEDDTWVGKIMKSVHHTPFSRVRALFGQMDEAEARARGYIKGNEKANIKLAIMKRTTQPTTVYIKMKMDRDDIVDINDFDVVAWQRAEMRKQLDHELARAFLIGDGREAGDDKIDENCIRPIVKDDPTFTIQYTVTDGKDYKNDFNSASENDSEAKGIIRAAVKARKQYKGSGTPTFFTTEDLLTELLLIEDQNGRRIYESEQALATAMRVKEIVTVSDMEALTDVYGIIVNMADYNTGADKGGAVSMFEDFDIDYNQQKYLMETRCSGALVKPYSAIVLKKESAAG